MDLHHVAKCLDLRTAIDSKPDAVQYDQHQEYQMAEYSENLSRSLVNIAYFDKLKRLFG